MNNEKKLLADKINNLVQSFEKENDIKIDWISITHKKYIGFASSDGPTETKLYLKNE